MKTELSDLQSTILEGIREGKMLREIAEELGLSRQWISENLHKLMELGLVLEPRRARYITTDEPNTYRKKPEVVVAVRFVDVKSGKRIVEWADGSLTLLDSDPGAEPVITSAGPGRFRAEIGEWVVRKSNGKFRVIKAEAFNKDYEAVIL